MPMNTRAVCLMNRFLLCIALPAAILLSSLGCKTRSRPNGDRGPVTLTEKLAVSGGFTLAELRSFAAFEPIDTHTHVRRVDPGFNAMLDRLQVHLLDILIVNDRDPEQNNLRDERREAEAFTRSRNGRAALCTTFDPYRFNDPGFATSAIKDLDDDFANGAIAVKLWKNVGMEIKDAKGKYILPDDPVLTPIYNDIAARNKTLIAHIAGPDSGWAPPNPASPDYSYYAESPEWYMFGKPNLPSKEKILAARDHVLDQHPNLRVVGAHLGSLESNFPSLEDHLDRYPNFAVDVAGRLPYLALLPRNQAISFILKYQDRLIYATDLELHDSDSAVARMRFWEDTYAREFRFLSTNDTVQFETVKVQGLALPNSVLRKIYHDNAVRWIPGIIASH
jgi:predicted TIM-barrel fold metal-dependent hydrolase